MAAEKRNNPQQPEDHNLAPFLVVGSRSRHRAHDEEHEEDVEHGDEGVPLISQDGLDAPSPSHGVAPTKLQEIDHEHKGWDVPYFLGIATGHRILAKGGEILSN